MTDFNDWVDGLSVDTIGGSERIPEVDSNVSKYITPDLLKTYILAALTASGAVTPTTGDALLIERAGTEGTFDLDALCDYVYAYLWTDPSEVTPATSADKFIIDRSGTKYSVDIDTLVTYINSSNGTLGAQITALSAATLADSDEYALSQGGTAKKVTFTNLSARVHAQLNDFVGGLSAVVTPADADKVYVLQGTTAKYVTLTTLANAYLAAELDVEDFDWGMTEADPAVAGDMLLMERGGTRYKLDVDTLVTYAGSGLQSAVLDFSALAAATPNTADRFVVDDAGTEKQLTLANLETKLWTDFATYVAGLSENTTVTATDKIYVIQSGTAKWMDPDALAAYLTVTDGDVIGPVATTEDNVPQWDSTTKTLKDGLTVVTAVRFDGTEVDTALATEKAVSEAVEDITNLDIDGATDIGAALSGTDLMIVDDGAGGTNRKSAVSRIKTYLETVGHYDNIWVGAERMHVCTTNGAAALAKNEYGTNDIDLQYFAFDGGATEERVQFAMPMPEDWDRGTIKAKFYWSSATSSTTADTVEWSLKAGAVSDNGAIDTALGTAQVISDALLADNGTDLQVTGATPAITIAGSPALGDFVVFEISRNTDGTDDMVEDAWLFGVMLQYQRNKAVAAW